MVTMPSRPQVVKFGVFEVDLEAGEIRKAGVRQKLAGQPFQVLQVLLEHPQEIVTREELRERLWPGNTFVDYELALKKAVNRLRGVLGDSAESPRFIETVPRRGYRFLATVEARKPSDAEAAARATLTGRRFSWPLTASSALALIGALLLGFHVDKLRTRIFAKSRLVEIHSLAVLPLENLSRDQNQDYFSEGITDALTTELAQISSLRVISRTSAMHFKGTRETLPDIGRELNVDAVVEGSITRSENRVRITAQLIDARADRHLWAKSYEREAQDIVLLQDELARNIANEIRVNLSPEARNKLSKSRSVIPEAYEAYLKGRYFWNRRTEPELYRAKEYFEQAIAKDPAFAPAYAGLADTYFYLSYAWGHMPPREGMPLSKTTALKAIELDDSAADGHASLGTVKFLYEWDVAGAEQEFRRAIELNPNYEMGHHAYSVLLASEHRNDESVSQAQKAVEVDPLSPAANNILAGMLQAAGRCDEVIAQSLKGLEQDPNPTHVALLRGHLVGCYQAEGRQKEAFDEMIKVRVAQGASAEEVGELRSVYARSGQKGLKQRDLRRALKRWQKDSWHSDAWEIAGLYSDLGDLDNALRWIDKCIELRSTMLMWLYVGPGTDPLHRDPRFAEVKRKMGVQN